MKNLPDKVYLSFGEMSEERFGKEDYKELCEYSELVVFNEHKSWETDVEYARTDTFIEKALKFLDGSIPDYIELKHANVDTFMDVNNERFIKDFINYMKGE